MKVLVIDDDPAYVSVLCAHLTQEGFEAISANAALEGLDLAASERPDLVLLDVRMPDMDGLEVCRALRDAVDTPVFFLSALGDEFDIVRALQHGGDDYLVKPFSLAELRARIQALLRRRAGEVGRARQRYEDDDLTIDLVTRQVFRRGQRVSLSPTEFRLLATLVERRGQVVSQGDLLRELWGAEEDLARVRQLALYVSYLRRKLTSDPAAPSPIRTRRGVGYWFAGPLDADPE
ncbi:MAG: response regulator transcription factor [Anaerolineae bacterium]